MVDKVAFSGPDIQEEDIDLVSEVIRSGWLTHGEYSRKLEELFCDYTGARYAVTVANCTAGLHLSCLAAGFGSGDEVIVNATWNSNAGSHALRVVIDPDGAIDEVDSDNNERFISISVQATEEEETNSTLRMAALVVVALVAGLAYVSYRSRR